MIPGIYISELDNLVIFYPDYSLDVYLDKEKKWERLYPSSEQLDLILSCISYTLLVKLGE